MQPFSTPWKTLENLTLSWCFQGVGKGCIVNEWVNKKKFPDVANLTDFQGFLITFQPIFQFPWLHQDNFPCLQLLRVCLILKIEIYLAKRFEVTWMTQGVSEISAWSKEMYIVWKLSNDEHEKYYQDY